MKILVVDDESVILESARRILTADGHEVVTAADAETALPLLPSDSPDLLITDLILPGMSGQRLMEYAHEHDPNLPVIITTGYSTVERAVESLQHGALDFLPKPFTFEELLSPVRRAVEWTRLDISERTQAESETVQGRFHLGRHSWAYLDTNATALLGLSWQLLLTVADIVQIDFPEPETRLRQGDVLARLHTIHGLVHRTWSPLGGQVLEINPQVREHPDLPHSDRAHAKWLVRVRPSDLDEDLARLSHGNG